MLAVRPFIRESTRSSRFSSIEENKSSSNLSTVEPIVKMSASEISSFAPHTASLACNSTDLRSESQVDLHCANITGCLPSIKSRGRLNHHTHTPAEQSMVTSAPGGIQTNTNIFMTNASDTVHQKYSHITNVDIDFPALAETYFQNSDVKKLPEAERKERNKMIPVQSNLIKEVGEISGTPSKSVQEEVTVIMSQQLSPVLAPKES